MVRLLPRALLVLVLGTLLLGMTVDASAFLRYGAVKYRVVSIHHPQWKHVHCWNDSDHSSVLRFKCGDVLFTAGDEPVPKWINGDTYQIVSKKRRQPEVIACDIEIEVAAGSEVDVLIKTYCFDETCPAAPEGAQYDYPYLYDAGARSIMLGMNEANPLSSSMWEGASSWSSIVESIRAEASSTDDFYNGEVYNFRQIQKRLWRYIANEDQDISVYRLEGREDEGLLPRIDPWWLRGA